VKRRTQVLSLLCVLGAILYLDRVCISLALQEIQLELEISATKIGLVSVAFSLGYALFEIPTGHLGDRFGARSTLMRICVAWSVFTALTGAAFGLGSLLVIRFLFGAGEAGAWPNVGGVVSRWYPANQRARAMGIFGAATALGGGLAPLIVIPIQRDYGWRASFFVFGGVGILWAIVWYRWFRDSPAAMGASQAEIDELGSAPVPVKHGAPWRKVLRTRTMWLVMLSAFANIYAAFFAVFWLPTFLRVGRGFSPDELKWTALTWVASFVGNALGGFVSDHAVRRFGRRAGRTSIAISCGVATGCLFVGVVLVRDKQATIALLTGTGLLWGFIQSNMFAGTIDIAGKHTGSIAGAMNTAGQLGGAASAFTFGALVDATGGYDIPVLVLGAAATLAGLAWIGIDAGTPVVPDDEPTS
jgi:sugar phosphate permease